MHYSQVSSLVFCRSWPIADYPVRHRGISARAGAYRRCCSPGRRCLRHSELDRRLSQKGGPGNHQSGTEGSYHALHLRSSEARSWPGRVLLQLRHRAPHQGHLYCKALKVFDNEGCLGFPTLWIPLESPLEDKCIPEHYFSDEVKSISFQLDCREDAPVKKEPYGPKEGAEQFAPQAEHSTKQDAQQGSHQGQEVQNSPKQEARQGSRPAEAAPKQEQEAEQASEAAPEKKASNPADSLGLGELTKVLGFR